MRFSSLLLKGPNDINESSEGSQDVEGVGAEIQSSPRLISEAKKPEEILRAAGFKIRLITPTSFGTQIDFAKKYDDDDIEKLLKDFTIKLKNKSLFIVH